MSWVVWVVAGVVLLLVAPGASWAGVALWLLLVALEVRSWRRRRAAALAPLVFELRVDTSGFDAAMARAQAAVRAPRSSGSVVGFAAAFRRLEAEMRKLAAAFGRLTLAALQHGVARRAAVRAHGPRNVAGDGTWQSDLCAAWLHGSCPAPAHCDCTCHGGGVR